MDTKNSTCCDTQSEGCCTTEKKKNKKGFKKKIGFGILMLALVFAMVSATNASSGKVKSTSCNSEKMSCSSTQSSCGTTCGTKSCGTKE